MPPGGVKRDVETVPEACAQLHEHVIHYLVLQNQSRVTHCGQGRPVQAASLLQYNAGNAIAVAFAREGADVWMVGKSHNIAVSLV